MGVDRPRGRLLVAVVTETYPPEINGVANTMRHLVEGLEKRGHRIHLIRPRQQRDRSLPKGQVRRLTLIPGMPIPGYRGLRFGLPAVGTLRATWGRLRPHVVYIATQGPLGHAALMMAQASGIPTVTGFHTQFHQYSRHYGLGILYRGIVHVLRRFHNRSDATLVPTEELRDQLCEQGFKEVHIFSRGVDTELFAPSRRSAALRSSWQCADDDPVVLYVGRLAAEKNLDLALETFAAIKGHCPNARFALVGSGPEMDRLKRTHPDYLFTGIKVGVELAEHYASGDLFLFPSLTETYGNVVTEAMASGLPVIAYDYAAAGSHIRPRHNGVTVPCGDSGAFIEAALGAISDRPALRAMGRRARDTAESMSWEGVIHGVEKRLYEVIRRRAGLRDPRKTIAATSD